jgi:DNA-binding CsgD family transcriptional regulator
VEAEQSLSFAGLVSLLRPWVSTFDRAGSASAEVLRGVVQRGEPASALALGVAVLQLVSALAADRPVLVVLDDAHWLDEPTLDAIRFAVRRLDRESVAVLVAARTGAPAQFDGAEVLDVGGIDGVSARTLLSSGGPVTLEVALACADACGGNPLALLEIGRHLTPAQRVGRDPLPAVMPIGDGLTQAFHARVVDLPPRTRQALLVVALAGSLPPNVLDDALGRFGLSRLDLGPALEALILVSGPPGPGFCHPLLRTATAAAASPEERRAAHRALAEATAGYDDERHAWHLADAAEGDDREARDALIALATRATELGAHLAAARAWDRAATLTTTRFERAACQLAAGVAFMALAVPHEAVPRLQAALADAEPGEQRGRVAFALTDMTGWGYSIDDAVRLGRTEALAVERSHPAVASQILAETANMVGLGGNLRLAVELSVRAEEIAERADPISQFASRIFGTHLRVVHGEVAQLGDRLDEFDVLRDLAVPGAPFEVLQLAQLAGFAYMVTERWEDALSLLDAVAVGARHLAQRGMENFALSMRGEVLWRLGRWPEARAESMVDAIYSEKVETAGAFGAATVARTEAAVGLVDDALRRAGSAVQRGETTGMDVLAAWGRHAEALAHLASGRPDAALEPLEWIWRLCRQGQVGDPGPLWWQGDLLEAQFANGRDDDALRLVTQLEAEAAATGRRWAAAVALRGRAVLDEDADAAARSVAGLEALGSPFEAARSRLVLADLLHGPARVAELTAALEAFEALGARPWEDRTRHALGQGPVTSGRHGVASTLTEGELRVALAVGRGLSNREAAAQLALSPKTVDAHLQAIYRKLGVRSRTELALLVAGEGR